jgi:tetratricopeptide (TPR) repeat protein
VLARDGLASESYGTALLDVGVHAARAGDPTGARAYLSQAVDMLRAASGEDSLQVAGCLLHLGWMALRQGDAAEALASFSRAAEIHDAHAGQRPVEQANVLSGLGQALKAGGEPRRAAEAFYQAVAIEGKTLRADDVRRVDTLTLLGMALTGAGLHDQAHASLTEALQLLRGASSADAPRLCAVLCGSSRADMERGRLDGAEQNAREALGVARRSLGDQSVEFDRAAEQLAAVLQKKGLSITKDVVKTDPSLELNVSPQLVALIDQVGRLVGQKNTYTIVAGAGVGGLVFLGGLLTHQCCAGLFAGVALGGLAAGGTFLYHYLTVERRMKADLVPSILREAARVGIGADDLARLLKAKWPTVSAAWPSLTAGVGA